MNDCTTAHDPEVLVVGAGPTGLVAAAQLARRGVTVRIIDVGPRRSPHSRALVVHARSLELLDKMGLADRLLAEGERTRRVELHVGPTRAAAFELGGLGEDDTPFPFVLFLSQVATERALDDDLAAHGIRVERPVALTGLTQDAEGVTAVVDVGGRQETIRAGWVIGADGAHSAVRHALGLSFEGGAYDGDFALGDVEVEGDASPEALKLMLGRRGLVMCFPMPEGKTRVMCTSALASDDEGPLTLAQLQRQVDEIRGADDLRLHDATWLSRFRLHHRGVDRYRVGRVFVAGDAAHIHSPAGGQGMNTGIQDAFDLAWKLAMVVRGQASDALLDSYHAERHPVGKRLLKFTDRGFRWMSSSNPIVTGLRNFVAPRLAPRILGSTRGAGVFRLLSQTAIRYRRSPLVAEVDREGDAAWEEGPRAGDRAPGAPLPGGHLLRRLTGEGWWLLGFCGEGEGEGAVQPQRWLRRLRAAVGDRPWISLRLVSRTPLADAIVDPEGVLHERYGVGGGAGLYLVRPDGYIAFRSPGPGVDALGEWLDGMDRRPRAAVMRALPSAQSTTPLDGPAAAHGA